MASTAQRPEEFARALLARFSVTQPVNLHDLGQKIGLSIREVESEGFEGALLRVPDRLRGIIAVRSDVREAGRRRFTIAHEIGHYILSGHGRVNSVCTNKQIECGPEEASDHEAAANRFASELLLPLAEVSQIVRERSASIEAAKFISERFQTSLTAAALKCVEASEEACALVISVEGIVSRYKSSSRFGHAVTLGQTVGRNTKAYYLAEGAEDRSDSGPVPTAAWVDAGSLPRGAMIKEDSILLPSYSKVLTILAVT